MITPTKRDRIWMQRFDRPTVTAIRGTLLRFYTASKKLEECDLVGIGDNDTVTMVTPATEFKLKGYPFWTSDSSGIVSSLLKNVENKEIFLTQLQHYTQKLFLFTFFVIGDEGGIATRQTLCRILETLRENGWEVS